MNLYCLFPVFCTQLKYPRLQKINLDEIKLIFLKEKILTQCYSGMDYKEHHSHEN